MRHQALLAVCWLLIGWTLVECRLVLRVFWRWLSCLTGHHRETVRYTLWIIGPSQARSVMDFVCVDCCASRPLYDGQRFTPSRRYALTKRGA